ncbi:hypothetical protein PROFUN_04734 [Planoprotostelium fungivorum]|uniref:Tf2-1-like SH3-like domain-containing protein n=1 Tax=Planoprotostelium fungivorum TaxID=1890364 RepID=A0A2P6NG11_9EUKA|nr:hypothetical protein PROFUN_04734 [Planoprotostelium fungivorum]
MNLIEFLKNLGPRQYIKLFFLILDVAGIGLSIYGIYSGVSTTMTLDRPPTFDYSLPVGIEDLSFDERFILGASDEYPVDINTCIRMSYPIHLEGQLKEDRVGFGILTLAIFFGFTLSMVDLVLWLVTVLYSLTNLEKARQDMKSSPDLSTRDKVLLSTKNFGTSSPKPKWADKWIGPYRILKEAHTSSYVLSLPPSIKTSSWLLESFFFFQFADCAGTVQRVRAVGGLAVFDGMSGYSRGSLCQNAPTLYPDCRMVDGTTNMFYCDLSASLETELKDLEDLVFNTRQDLLTVAIATFIIGFILFVEWVVSTVIKRRRGQ